MIRRSMKVIDVLAEESALPESAIADLEKNCLMLNCMSWDIRVEKYVPAIQANTNSWPGDPGEPHQFEIDLDPDEAANWLALVTVKQLGHLYRLTPLEYERIWQAIHDEEQRWQDEHLDDQIYALMRDNHND